MKPISTIKINHLNGNVYKIDFEGTIEQFALFLRDNLDLFIIVTDVNNKTVGIKGKEIIGIELLKTNEKLN